MRIPVRNVALAALLLAAHARGAGVAFQPQAAPSGLDRRFASLVPAASPVLTPRPTAVAGVAAPMLSLNGTWEFSPDGGAAMKPIEVPGEWAMQGFEVPPGAFATYSREVQVPADWRGQTVKLRFDAVHAVCEVSVNGQPVGGHEGGFVPFELDVTAAVRPGRNVIAVRVQSESIADSVSCVSQYAAHQVGGILRKVTLFCVPPVHVSRLWHETAVSSGDASLRVHAEVAASTAAAAPRLAVRLLDESGRVAAPTQCSPSRPLTSAAPCRCAPPGKRASST